MGNHNNLIISTKMIFDILTLIYKPSFGLKIVKNPEMSQMNIYKTDQKHIPRCPFIDITI